MTVTHLPRTTHVCPICHAYVTTFVRLSAVPTCQGGYPDRTHRTVAMVDQSARVARAVKLVSAA